MRESLGDCFQFSFCGDNKAYINRRSGYGECTSLASVEVLKMLHLGEEESQELDGNVLIGYGEG